ncbi:MAG TPA: TRAP transporter substrate-binding protein DctP [Vicinamibacterales bacterium]|nr:TRAP transporter substrate-binding protein DctP [Vicinamibacterales bacterium]
MEFRIDRRTVLKAGAALAASQALPAWTQDKPRLRLTGVYQEKDIRFETFQRLARDVQADFRIEQYLMGSLFKQGTELVAVQRDNLEMANIAPADVTKQIPAWSVLTSAYLFRDANHLLAFFGSDVGAQMKKMAEDQLKIKILGPVFYGTRQVGLKPKKKITTPADMAGTKLRMPAGDAWQLMGRALGANPTPLAFPEVYTALQTGAIDGQDNPLPIVQANKFYEVMSQIVLTSHWVAYDLIIMNLKTWNNMGPAKQKTFQAATDKALAYCTQEHLKREAELAESLKKEGLQFSTPDIKAFRAHAQKVYLASDEAKAWPPGVLEKIAAIK